MHDSDLDSDDVTVLRTRFLEAVAALEVVSADPQAGDAEVFRLGDEFGSARDRYEAAVLETYRSGATIEALETELGEPRRNLEWMIGVRTCDFCGGGRTDGRRLCRGARHDICDACIGGGPGLAPMPMHAGPGAETSCTFCDKDDVELVGSSVRSGARICRACLAFAAELLRHDHDPATGQLD